MKKIISFSLALALFGMLLITSCTKEDNTDNTTPTSTDPHSKYQGNWAVSENSKDFGPSTYNVTVTDSSDASYILFHY